MSKRTLILVTLLIGLLIGLVPTFIHNGKAYALTKFSEDLGCVEMGTDFMKDTPTPSAKALLCAATGTVVIIL